MRNLDCPKCKNTKLTAFTHEGITFDFCNDSCLGIWADKGELADYISEHEKNIPKPEEAKVTDLLCPRCINKRLIETRITKDSKTKVDLCISCNGIWFDKNELGKVKQELVKVGLGNKISVTTKFLEEKGFSLFK